MGDTDNTDIAAEQADSFFVHPCNPRHPWSIPLWLRLGCAVSFVVEVFRHQPCSGSPRTSARRTSARWTGAASRSTGPVPANASIWC